MCDERRIQSRLNRGFYKAREYLPRKYVDGNHAIDAAAMPIEGVWEVIAETTVSDFEKSRFGAKVSIR